MSEWEEESTLPIDAEPLGGRCFFGGGTGLLLL